MVEERGIVVRLRDGQAQVEFVRQAACGSCGAKSACGSGALGELFGRRRHLVWLSNATDAVLGDTVVVGMEESAFVATSAVAYLLPLGTLFAGALAAETIWHDSAGSELPAILGAGAGLALGLFGLRRWNRGEGSRSHFRMLRKEPKSVTAVTFP